jgi:hypothetical protein
MRSQLDYELFKKSCFKRAPSGEDGLMRIRFRMRAIFQRKPPNLFHYLRIPEELFISQVLALSLLGNCGSAKTDHLIDSQVITVPLFPDVTRVTELAARCKNEACPKVRVSG